ncbi:T9SS type A sorting domain-containing protein [candidate division KSB1 bacterium]|nr:T9SS type A sorting domain-containing protein [candidate division KSB1 bacterium]
MVRSLIRFGKVVGVLLIFSNAWGEWIPADGSQANRKPEIRILESNGQKIRLSVVIPGLELERVNTGGQTRQILKIPGEGTIEEVGKPDLPLITCFVALPPDKNVELTLTETQYVTLPDLDVAAVQLFGPDGQEMRPYTQDGAFYQQDTFYPDTLVRVGKPVILREMRFVPVIICPVQYNPVRREAKFFHQLGITLTYSGANPTNPKLDTRPKPSTAFETLYQDLVINYETPDDPSSGVEGGYLFIVPASGYEAILPLAEWKRQMGYSTMVVTPPPQGSTANAIKAFISNAYFNQEEPPTYVVLVGDVDGNIQIPTFYFFNNNPWWEAWDVTDHPYGLLEGDDYFPEVFVGRLSVSSISELNTVVAKILSYERDPYLEDPQWLQSALLVVDYSMGSWGVVSARDTKLWVRDQLLDYGYTRVDTAFYSDYSSYTPDPIINSINSGVGFVNYRGAGWEGGWTVFRTEHISSLNNGPMLPVVTSIVCGGGNFGYYEPCFGEAWIRAGSVWALRGGVSFVGPTDLFTQTRWNNCLDAGIYQGILNEGVTHFGPAVLRGKMELYRNFPLYAAQDISPNSVKFYFYTYVILGDPGLGLRTKIPTILQADHPAQVSLGTNYFDLFVSDDGSQPVGGALVCLLKEGEVFSRGTTDPDGFLTLAARPDSGGPLLVTVTKSDYVPYQDTVWIFQDSVFVGVDSFFVDDDSLGESWGNGDGLINPGETVSLGLRLKNFGTSDTAQTVIVVLRSLSGGVTLLDSVAFIGDLPPDSAVVDTGAFLILIDQILPDGYTLRLGCHIYALNWGWEGLMEMPVVAFELIYLDHWVDGVLDPGETGNLVVRLLNNGACPAYNITGRLRSSDSLITLMDSTASFGDVEADSVRGNETEPFGVWASPAAMVGHRVSLSLELLSDGVFLKTVFFTVTLGTVTSADPLGPDDYGYYAYDDTDLGYAEAPVYDWVEIDPYLGGSGTVLSLVDIADPDPWSWEPYPQGDSQVLPLPFTFRFYGLDYDTITVCSNGWLSMGRTWMNNFRNWAIPAAMGPPALIAPFWDDLHLGGGGRVLVFFDGENHRFIIEWSRVRNAYGNQMETFEVLLLDPVYHPTPTGDGVILVQYNTVHNVDSYDNYATVGIENESHDDGLQYSYANLYPPAAAPLADGRAIKFIPATSGLTEIAVLRKMDVPEEYFLAQNYPNPFNPVTTITYGLPKSGHVTLRVYNILGQEVASLIDCSLGAGVHRVRWDAAGLSSGIYFYHLKADGFSQTKKMVFVR